jgi:hypothetical protein
MLTRLLLAPVCQSYSALVRAGVGEAVDEFFGSRSRHQRENQIMDAGVSCAGTLPILRRISRCVCGLFARSSNIY